MAHQWINNMPYRQSGTFVYRQPSGPSTPTHKHSSIPDYTSFDLPFQNQTGFSVYQNASSHQKQSEYSSPASSYQKQLLEYSSSPSMSEPSPPSSSSDDRSESGKEKKVWLKEEVICLIEGYAKKKNDFKNPKVRNKDIWCDISHEI